MIAISYRREDSLPVAGRLYDRLQAEFGRGNVFMDFDSIPYGVDFRDHIKQMIDRSKVLVAMIGPDWTGRRRQRGRRIDDPTDFVRLEIAYALERNLPIIPILVSNTRMPRPEELPKDIEALAFRNALNLDAGIDFHHHAERLVTAINRLLITSPPTIPVHKPLPDQVASTESSLAPFEAQLASPPLPTTSEVAVRPSTPSRKSPLLESVPPPTAPALSSTSILPATKAGPVARTQSIVLQKAKALVPQCVAVLRNTKTRAGAILSRAGGSLDSLKAAAIRNVRMLIDYLRRHHRTIVVSASYVIAVIFAAATLYLGFRSNAFHHWLSVISSRATKLSATTSANAEPHEAPPPEVLAPPSESPGAMPTPALTAVPVPPRGVINIDSTPRGQAFELIGADGSHQTGTTPTTLEDLAIGSTQVIFKRTGFLDHSETVWLASNTSPSVTWNFPDDTRARDSAQPNQQVPPPASPINPLAQNSRTWQAWIGDFVKQFVAVNQQQDADATVAFYAPSVDYFGARGKDQGYILRDVEKYNLQWPRRRDSMDGSVHVEEKVPNRQYRANFKLNFYAENASPAEWSKGQLATTLDINVIDGIPQITAINQKRLQHQNGRGKGPRPPEMEATLRPINPKKFTKVLVKKYGFSALLPTDLFPDAEMKLADGNTDHISSVRGCATASFSAPHDAIRNVYDQCLGQSRAAPNRRNVDYKVVKDTWFVVSGGSKTTGYYIKGVKHGDDVFVMDLEYGGGLCNIPSAMLTEISQKFDGKLDAVALPSASGSEAVRPPAIQGSPSALPNDGGVQKLTRVYVKKYGVSALFPTDIFPNAKKLSNSGSFLQGKSWTGQTTMTFSSVSKPLAKVYAECTTEHSPQAPSKTVQYKMLKPTWFVVSGDLGPEADGSLGFYTKGVKKGRSVVIMHLQWREDDFPFSQEAFTAMSRGFDGN